MPLPPRLFHSYASPVKANGLPPTAGIFRGAVTHSRVAQEWSDDAALAKGYGKQRVLVQLQKRDADDALFTVMPLSKFLKRSATAGDVVLKFEVGGKLQGIVDIPGCLRCENFMDKMTRVEIQVAHSGSATEGRPARPALRPALSLLEELQSEWLFCAYVGEAKALLFDEENVPRVHIDPLQGVAPYRVDDVDTKQYPRLKKARAYEVDLAQGDCVFAPRGWAIQTSALHTGVQSAHSVVGTFQWDRMRRLRESGCDSEGLAYLHDPNDGENPLDEVWAMMQKRRAYKFTYLELVEGTIGLDAGKKKMNKRQDQRAAGGGGSGGGGGDGAAAGLPSSSSSSSLSSSSSGEGEEEEEEEGEEDAHPTSLIPLPADVCIKSSWEDMVLTPKQYTLRDFGNKMKEVVQGVQADKFHKARGLHKERLPAGGLMKMAWAGPVIRLNVARFFDGVDLETFNDRLEAIILNHWERLQDKWGSTLCKGKPASQCDINNAFFWWQNDGGYKKYFAEYPEFEALGKMMDEAARRYLQACGLGKPEDAFELGKQKSDGRFGGAGERAFNASDSVHPWVTVHDNCLAHLAHDHPGTMVAGTYYVRTPNGSGALKLYDPRTMHREHVIIRPREGEMILFPPWLMHQVLPTDGTGAGRPRISVAFNFAGFWEATTDVGTSYGIPQMKKAEVEGVRYP
eukprot:g511.t1